MPLDTTLVVDFSFGLDLSDGSIDNGDFFLRPGGSSGTSPLQLKAEIDATLPDFDLVAGFTQPLVQGGTVRMDPGLDVAWGNVEMSMTALQAEPGPTVTLTPSGNASAELPVEVSFLDFAEGGARRSTWKTTDPSTTCHRRSPSTRTSHRSWRPTRKPPTLCAVGFDALADFADKLDTTDKLGESIFLIGGSVGEFLDLGSILRTHLASPIRDFSLRREFRRPSRTWSERWRRRLAHGTTSSSRSA